MTTPSPAKRDRAAALWLVIFGAGAFAAFAICTVLAAMVPTTYGDLTRIGIVSERQFGWRAPQPDVPDHLRATAGVDEADVLVIGDSFSGRLVWQSALAAAGLKVATTRWPKNGVCANLDQWLSVIGFKGRTVIAQTVERYTVGRVAQSQACTMKGPIQQPTLGPMIRPTANYSLGVGAGVRVNLVMLQNARRAERAPTGIVLPNPLNSDTMRVAAMTVEDGCARFSHPLCSKALFLVEDAQSAPLTAADAAAMERLKRSVKTVNLVWVVVPNKTTVYLQPERADTFRRAFNDLKLGPDLFALAHTGRDVIKDLYWANDSHWSTAGQLYFGEAVRTWLQ